MDFSDFDGSAPSSPFHPELSGPASVHSIEFNPVASDHLREILSVSSPSVSEVEPPDHFRPEPSAFEAHETTPFPQVKIGHIDPTGPEIKVSTQRLPRMLARREKRKEFLEQNPEFAVPYKKRPERSKDPARQRNASIKRRGPGGQFKPKAP